MCAGQAGVPELIWFEIVCFFTEETKSTYLSMAVALKLAIPFVSIIRTLVLLHLLVAMSPHISGA